MSYGDSIRIERCRDGFEVHLTDPEIRKKNDERSKGNDGVYDGKWMDPHVEYKFDTKEKVITFLTSAIDIAMPAESFSSAFDKLAKEAQDD